MNNYQDAFISYGRADSKAFAAKLYEHLTQQGLKVWFDFENIPLGVDFQNQIDDGIEKADNFLFIIAPHSVNSPYCLKEVELALKRHKRIIPLLHVEQISRETWQQRYPNGTDADWEAYTAKGLHSSFPNMHPEIGKINWVYFREGIDDFDQSFAGLLEIFNRHQEYVHFHTHFLNQALAWENNQKQSRYLLVAEERQQAKNWLKIHYKDEQPPCTPTDLHCEYITESIKHANNLMTQVFLAYAHEDKPIMEKIRKSLQREAFTVWTNTSDIQTGESFEKAIQRGIEQADNIVYLLSPQALESKYCQQELDYALSNNKRIIPVLVRETNPELVPSVLRTLQYIDLTDNVKEEDYLLDESQLIKILHQDELYYQEHKNLLVKALKWKQQDENPSILLRGFNLRHAEAWLKMAKKRDSHLPTLLQEEFISESLRQPPATSLDVFVSYSRADSEFAHQLNDALQMQGKTTWFDQESIPSSADFQQEIFRGIEVSNNFVFILSPHSVNSPYCADEVEYAAKLNKRFVTLLHQDVNPAELHPELAKIQWIAFNHGDTDFSTNFSQLIRTLDTDREHVQNHTKWSQQALEWETKDKDPDLLLRGSEFTIAQSWLQTALDENKKPAATELQQLFISESQKAIAAAEAAEKERQAQLLRLQEEKAKEAEARLAEQQKHAKRQKLFLTAVSIAFGISTVLGGVSYSFFRQAKTNQQKAEAASVEALARSSEALYGSNRNLEALLAALKANQLLKKAKQTNPNLDYGQEKQINAVLKKALYGLREFNRFSGKDGHKAAIFTVAFSPDGKTIASGSEDNTIKLWNSDGSLQKTLTEHQGTVYTVAFSPDGELMASGSVDETIKLWQKDGTLLNTLTGHTDEIKVVTFSSDGELIASASNDQTIKLWQKDGTLLNTLTGHTDEVKAVAFSPDGELIVSASDDQTLKLWQRDGTLIKTLTGHTDQVKAVAFSPDGELIASASEDQTLKLWQRDGTLVTTLTGHKAPVRGVTFSPDGKTFASASNDQTIKLWTRDGSLLNIISGHTDRVTGVAFSPDGKTIASTSEDNTVRLWKLEQRFLNVVYAHDDEVNAVAASPDGKLIASASYDNKVKLWGTDGTLQRTLEQSDFVNDVVFSPDGEILATASRDSKVKLWNRDGSVLATLEESDIVNEISFSPDGELIASASDNRTITLWNQNGDKLKTLTEHSDKVQSVEFSPDGQFIVSGSSDNTIKLWNRDGELLNSITAHGGRVNDVSFSPDSQMIASASVDNAVKVWKINGNQLTLAGTFEGVDSFNKVIFSPDGKKIAAASADKTVKVLDSQGKLLATFYGHNDTVNGVIFSPNGEKMASVSNDKTMIIWHLDKDIDYSQLEGDSCILVRDYLRTNTELDELDRVICDGSN